MNCPSSHGLGEPDPDEVILVARGIATAVAPESGLTAVQADLLGAVAEALTGTSVDYHALEPLGCDEFAAALAGKSLDYRQRIVHHMVLGELVLRPIPIAVAYRVATYAAALDIKDDFVRIARRYAQGAYGLAWIDLQRNGFVDHVRETGEATATKALRGTQLASFKPARVDRELASRWHAFEHLPDTTLGHSVWEMYHGRGFELPGTIGGAPAYLAQHDFVHVLADYGTNLKGELEVFGFIGRADPDPKGFAWMATLIGLFETGFIADTGFFSRDVSDRNIQAPGMHQRIADAIRRGKVMAETFGRDLFEVDYYAIANRPVDELRAHLGIPAKSPSAIEAGSAGAFDVAGMSMIQRQRVIEREGRSK